MPPPPSRNSTPSSDPIGGGIDPDVSRPTPLSIGQLEAGYPLYCKALRRLIVEGRSLERIQRTQCWQRLATLHACLPGQYRDPGYLYLVLRRQSNHQD